ncbi:MAG: Kdo hydroxylase family protein [Gemmataceae bacterium]
MHPLTQRLEAGEIVRFAGCPFALPDEATRHFLFEQRTSGEDKYIRYLPDATRLVGAVRVSAAQEGRLVQALDQFSAAARSWLGEVLPDYARSWSAEQVTWRTEEEATRRLPTMSRSDLLHVDAFAVRPTHGARILRLFVNLHPNDPRVWATSDSFAEVLTQFGDQVGLPHGGATWTRRWGHTLLRLFRPAASAERNDYDAFMLRLHHCLKNNDDYQERAVRRLYSFQPGEAWLAFTDGICHAELRGRFALEHTFFVPPSVLALPDQSPLALLERACGRHLGAAA